MALIHRVCSPQSYVLAFLVLISCNVCCTSCCSNELQVSALSSTIYMYPTKVCLDPQKYVGKRISYYPTSNCCSTFQLSFSQCGDIHPNPGPSSSSEDPDTNTCIVDRISVSKDRIKYDIHTLSNLNSKQFRVFSSVWSTLKHLGICRGRTRRCRKGGRCRRRQQLQEAEKGIENSVTFALWNARSLNNKTHMFCDLMISNRIDIAALTETWLSGDNRDNIPLAQISSTLQNFNFHHIPRVGRVGGGVAICINKSYQVKRFELDRIFTSFEHIDVLITSHRQVPVRLVVLYRPQRTASGQSTDQLFLEEFATLMEQLVSSSHQLMIVGDFNYHLDSATDSVSGNFLNLISSFNLQQHVQFPTHVSGHTLDLVLTRGNDNFVSSVSSVSYLPSDHVAVLCSMDIRKPKPMKIQVRTRKIRNIDIDAFRQDILLSELYSFSSDNINEHVDQFEYTLSSLLDKHAPEVTRTITSRPQSPWYSDDLRQLKRELRGLERKAFPHGLEIDRENFRKAAHHYSNCLKSAKSEYHRNQFRNYTTRTVQKKLNS